MTYAKAIGLLGGTFDPIHKGHLSIAQQVQEALSLPTIEFIPCFQPAHRAQPIASAQDRLTMAQRAIAPHPTFSVNSIEIDSGEVSYTINTLRALRKKNPLQPFCFIIGADAFAQFDEWHDYEEIVTLVHLIVVSREHTALPTSPAMQKLLSAHQTTDKNKLHKTPGGYIYFQSLTPIDISATKIRAALKAGEKDIKALPKAVMDYITINHLYSGK